MTLSNGSAGVAHNLLKNKISVRILLYLWHETDFKLINASDSWIVEEERAIDFHGTCRAKKEVCILASPAHVECQLAV